jgi:hypothetical protein
LAPYRVNPKREFYYITREEIQMIFNGFNELNRILNTEEKLLEYIQKNNPEYFKKIKYVKRKILTSNKQSPVHDLATHYKTKKKKRKYLYVDTSNL